MSVNNYIYNYKQNIQNISHGRKRILSHFTGCKKWRTWYNTREIYKPLKERQNLAETDKGSYYNKEEWLEEFLDGKSSESDDSDNDDENYNENNDQQQLPKDFANSCHIIVSPILPLELIRNFAAWKHCYCCTNILLVEDVSHGFGLELHISKRNHTFYYAAVTSDIF